MAHFGLRRIHVMVKISIRAVLLNLFFIFIIILWASFLTHTFSMRANIASPRSFRDTVLSHLTLPPWNFNTKDNLYNCLFCQVVFSFRGLQAIIIPKMFSTSSPQESP